MCTRASCSSTGERGSTLGSEIDSGVYVMKCQGRYKIGVSGCVSKRLEKLNTASPFKIELVDIFSTSIPYPLERYLHHSFSAQNVRGEWFTLDPQDLEQLRQIARAFPDQLPLNLQGGGRADMTLEPKLKPTTGAKPESDNKSRERLWLCPLCNFLTHRPGICDQCKKEGIRTVVHHTVQFSHSGKETYPA